MSEINEHITSLIIAQLSGSATDAELEELYQWLKSDPANASIYTDVKNSYWSRTKSSSEQKRNEVFSKIKSRIEDQPKKSIPDGGKRRRIFLAGAAASILVVLMAGWWFTQKSGNIVEVVQLEKYSPRGKKLHILLSDGSKVWLNADSKLTFPEKFVDEIRNVNLEGEAFFKIKRNTSKPFIVSTKNAEIEVLGTSFNINAREEFEATKTSVVSGSVKVSNKSLSNSVSLVKNQQVTVHANGELQDVEEVNATELMAWTSNRLFFDNILFSDVVKELERWYDVDFTITDVVVESKLIRAKFENPSLEQILEYISEVNQFDFVIEEDKVTISSKK